MNPIFVAINYNTGQRVVHTQLDIDGAERLLRICSQSNTHKRHIVGYQFIRCEKVLKCGGRVYA